MFDYSKPEDLAKSGKTIGNFLFKRVQELEKTFAFYKAMAAHHDAMAAQHGTHAAAMKAHHDGLPNEDVHKAAFAAHHTHHTAMSAHHGAIAKACADHADTMKAEIDAMKAAAAEFGVTKADGPAASLLARAAAPGGIVVSTGHPIADMVNDATAQLTKKALETFDTDPTVQQFLRETIMKMVGEAIGSTVAPPAAVAVVPTVPDSARIGIMAVPRTGQRAVAAAAPTPAVPLEFAKLFSSEDGDEGRL